ncbi:ligand-gated ion channel [Planktothrix mougeotii]|uniref:Uncharacterized protein n=1 Tax=Planktothrix mougeotii LEGE 06226 TaxID=1828728 RepID=A0ABR9UEV9_9CYAN|nr:hypothetical protein [Planktothrix mougeotii]MBE9144999.1 hypothetical protein [Planktothrix mougeotii LEGE 06226]
MILPKRLIKLALFFGCLIILLIQNPLPVHAKTLTQKQQAPIGIFIDTLSDFNISNGSFSANFWLWSLIDKGEKNPFDSLEFMNALRIETPNNLTIPTSKGIWVQKKVSGTFRHHWNMRNFPFDTQKLKIIFEETEDDIHSFSYQPDIGNSSIDQDIQLEGWKIKKFTLNAIDKQYLSNFGNPTLPPGAASAYSRFEIMIELQRTNITGFFKMIAGALASVGLCLVSYFLYEPDIGSLLTRFGLHGTSLFAVILSLRSNSGDLGSMAYLTLIDCIHLAVIVYILVATAIAIYIWLQVQKKGDLPALTRISSQVGVVSTLALLACIVVLMIGAATHN